MDIPMRGLGCITAEINSFSQEGICGSEYTTDILHASDIFKHQNHGQFLGFLKLSPILSRKLVHTKFSHTAKILKTLKLNDLRILSMTHKGLFKLFTQVKTL